MKSVGEMTRGCRCQTVHEESERIEKERAFTAKPPPPSLRPTTVVCSLSNLHLYINCGKNGMSKTVGTTHNKKTTNNPHKNPQNVSVAKQCGNVCWNVSPWCQRWRFYFSELRHITRGFSHSATTLQRQAEQPQPRP